MRDYQIGRRIVLGNMAMLVLCWVPLVVMPLRISAVDLIVTGVFASAAVYILVAVPAAALRRVRPLPVGLTEGGRASSRSTPSPLPRRSRGRSGWWCRTGRCSSP